MKGSAGFAFPAAFDRSCGSIPSSTIGIHGMRLEDLPPTQGLRPMTGFKTVSGKIPNFVFRYRKFFIINFHTDLNFDGFAKKIGWI